MVQGPTLPQLSVWRASQSYGVATGRRQLNAYSYVLRSRVASFNFTEENTGSCSFPLSEGGIRGPTFKVAIEHSPTFLSYPQGCLQSLDCRNALGGNGLANAVLISPASALRTALGRAARRRSTRHGGRHRRRWRRLGRARQERAGAVPNRTYVGAAAYFNAEPTTTRSRFTAALTGRKLLFVPGHDHDQACKFAVANTNTRQIDCTQREPVGPAGAHHSYINVTSTREPTKTST